MASDNPPFRRALPDLQKIKVTNEEFQFFNSKDSVCN